MVIIRAAWACGCCRHGAQNDSPESEGQTRPKTFVHGEISIQISGMLPPGGGGTEAIDDFTHPVIPRGGKGL